MSRIYCPVTTVNVTHTYYVSKGNRCSDLNLMATLDTQLMLRKYRLKWGAMQKGASDQYQLLQERIPNPALNVLPCNSAIPLLPLPDELCLRFYIRTPNQDFLNFTDGLGKAANEIWLWENDNAGQLQSRKLPYFGSFVTIAGIASPQTVTITGPDGVSFTEDSFPFEADNKASIDLTNKPPGIYNFTWTGDSLQAYCDPGIQQANAFGVLHLRKSASPAIAIANAYSLDFEAVDLHWKYYLLLKKEYVNKAFTITSPGQIFDPHTPIGNDPSISDLMEMNNGVTVLAFSSDAPIPFSDTPLAIKLEHPDVLDAVNAQLPNPSRGSSIATVFVTVDIPLLSSII